MVPVAGGGVLAGSGFWLLGATGSSPPGLRAHTGVFRGEQGHEGLAAGVEAYPAPAGQEPAGVPRVGCRRGVRFSARARRLWGCLVEGGGCGAGPEGRGLRCHTAGATAVHGTCPGRPGNFIRWASGKGARGGWCEPQGRKTKEILPLLFSVEKTPEGATPQERAGQGFFGWSISLEALPTEVLKVRLAGGERGTAELVRRCLTNLLWKIVGGGW